MNVKKILKENIGDYHPEQAIIFAETGEIYVTGKTAENEGFPVVSFLDKEELQSTIEKQVALEVERIALTKCGGHYNAGGYQST